MMEQIREKLEPVNVILSRIKGLDAMFTRCFMSTLETTCNFHRADDSFVFTGDIHAMWLRDSTEQVLHYLRFAHEIPQLREWIARVIRRQLRLVIADPYANAFNESANGRHGFEDLPRPGDEVWERKYELDSLCHVMLLVGEYYWRTGDSGVLDELFERAMETVLNVLETEQHHEARSAYRFQRRDCAPSDTLTRQGKGTPTAYTGMSWSGFRPSDDACEYGYLIPANLFCVKMLEDIKPLLFAAGRQDLGVRAEKLARMIREGISRFGYAEHPEFGRVYAYESDGLGHQLFMDDANVPGLLSRQDLGVISPDDQIYLNTRRFVLSNENPYYHAGTAAKGVGSPHTPQGYVWPIALCIQGLTATNTNEKAQLLHMLITTHAGTGLMHESFDPDAPEKFTREWFAWADSMFGEFVYDLYERGELEQIVQTIAGWDEQI